ncbi:TVP38/TMEM64 family protein [Roseibium marinum]|uniref:TVP38/TMEM64 family membrane protein n=1 Tax=Roseibium marinum TaxID=281252 RepID=A0A2S3V3C3_9HYPH|nr:TVP38/TMEM64 family protein [Roseibium marinum]POF34487.1 putative membrane protein YdjX (TVP38/TMEM64 family) [Roseibium marinum]
MPGDKANAMTAPKETEALAGETRKRSISARIRTWLPLSVLIALMGLAFSLGLHDQLTLSNLIMRRQELAGYVDGNTALALVVYLAVYTVAVALSFPGASLLTIAGGFLFGWVLGGFVTVLGATLGACAVFLVARTSLGDVLTRRAGPFLSRLADGFRNDAFNYLLFLRLTPVFPFWLVNIAPAIFRMPLPSYALATFVGIIPGTFAFTFIGSGLDSVIAAQEAADPGCAAAGTCRIELSALVTPQLLTAFFALGIVSLIPVILKKLRSR